jgi:hypothetical protein
MTTEVSSQNVFFYGLFMDPDVLRQKGTDPGHFRLARVDGYGLRIGERATLEPSENEQVFGSVIDLTDEDLDLLYADESVAEYVPVRITAFGPEGEKIEAVSYILPMELLSGRNPDYARALLAVAEKIGIPEPHLRMIESWM